MPTLAASPCGEQKKLYLPAAVLLLFTLAMLPLLCSSVIAAERDTHVGSSSEWSLLSGYGSSHPGWGETEVRVETIDLVLRHSSIILNDLGSSWYKGYHSLFLELPVHYLLEYENTPMIGLNFLASYTFTSCRFRPYIFAGGGPVYVDADIPGMGSDLNGNYQIGAGVKYMISDGHNLLLEARYHHISNANTSDPNDPLNSTKFLVGFTF